MPVTAAIAGSNRSEIPDEAVAAAWLVPMPGVSPSIEGSKRLPMQDTSELPLVVIL